MSSEPCVTVIIGTYNRAHLLPQAMESVLRQTLQAFELFVVDNGSPDNTRAVVERYAAGDARVRYLLNPRPSHSCAAPRNYALQQARGAYVAFVDDDDVWYAEKLQRCVTALEQRPAAGVVCHAERVVRRGVIVRTNVYGPWTAQMHARLLWEGNCLSPGAAVFRTEVLQRAGGFDTREAYSGCDDYDLWIRLARDGVMFHFLDEVLGEFRITGTNASLDPYHAVRLAEMVRGHIAAQEGPVLSAQGKARMASLYCYAARRLLRCGRWRDGARYAAKMLQCGYPGLRRLTADACALVIRRTAPGGAA